MKTESSAPSKMLGISGMMEKILCRICGEMKDVTEYYPSLAVRRKRSICMVCHRHHGKEYRRTHKLSEKAKKNHREYNKRYKKTYRQTARAKELWVQSHNKYVASGKYYETMRRRERNKRKTNARYRLECNFRCAMRAALNGNKGGRSWTSFVSYGVEELRAHLEKQFKPGMSWDNYGRNGWHIDHVIPISAFNYERPEDTDFKRCWSLSNLQPLWEKENISKHDTVDKPFQPYLLI